MSQPREPLRRIVVVGGGQLAVLTAIALRRASPASQVVVVGQPPSPASFADNSPTAMTFTNKLHDRLGIEEQEIVIKAGGSYRLVTRYSGWGGDGQSETLSQGEEIDPALKTAFARDWGRAKSLGGNARPVGSLAEVLADAGRFAPPPPDQPTPISNVDYALRWNPAAYRNLLIEKAQALQVHHVEGAIEAVQPGEGSSIAAISVAGQGQIVADLFVDCSGPAATLLASHPEFRMVDWSDNLPTRNVYLAAPGAPAIALDDRIALTETGWISQVAGRDSVHIMLGTTDAIDRDAALSAIGGNASAVIALSSGRVAEPWLGNVIAIGDAAARFEPVGPLHLDLAHRQLDLLLEMLSGRDIEPLERAEYNRRSILMMDGVREVLAMHFASPRSREVFGGLSLPDRVEGVIDQFERRGRIPIREEACLSSQEQFALLVALGFHPGLAPVARRVDTVAEDRAREEFAAASTAALKYAPPYDQWLGSVLRSSQSPAG